MVSWLLVERMKRKEGNGYQIGCWFALLVLDNIGDRDNSGTRASIELNRGNESKLVSGSEEISSECVERHGVGIGSVMQRKRLSKLGCRERHCWYRVICECCECWVWGNGCGGNKRVFGYLGLCCYCYAIN